MGILPMVQEETVKYTYPPTHPKAGRTTTVRQDVWSCPVCGYQSNLSDDIKEHRITHFDKGSYLHDLRLRERLKGD